MRLTWGALAVSLWMGGEPQPKQRPRVVRGGKGTYTPSRTKKAESQIGWLLLQQYPGIVTDQDHDFMVDLTFRCRRRNTDADNLAKTVLDALNGIVWGDDRQVTELHVLVHRVATMPSTKIEIYTTTPVEMQP